MVCKDLLLIFCLSNFLEKLAERCCGNAGIFVETIDTFSMAFLRQTRKMNGKLFTVHKNSIAWIARSQKLIRSYQFERKSENSDQPLRNLIDDLAIFLEVAHFSSFRTTGTSFVSWPGYCNEIKLIVAHIVEVVSSAANAYFFNFLQFVCAH